MSRGPGPIPHRWLHCPRKSDTLIAGRFLAFKTPLKQEFESQIPIGCHFTPSMLVDLMRRHKVRIGLWIDLTNTNRFYDKHEIEDKGSQYIKLQCRGHGETPSREQAKAFIEIVEEFIEQHPVDAVGVHCTHGFNRTGFLIVSYMVEKMDCAVDAALMAFAQARPPGIYKADYIRELFRRYGDEEDAPMPPELPAWCLEYDDSTGHQQEDDDVEEQNDSARQGKKRKRQEGENSGNGEATPPTKRSKGGPSYNPNAVFMEGVPNVTLLQDKGLIAKLQDRVRMMCGSKMQGFSGAQPVSMDMGNMRFLTQMPYRVSWKADGTRYMMLIHREKEIYFFDRDNSVFAVEGIRFPSLEDPNRHLADTLVDGEMVIDKYGDQLTPRYLVYDVIYFQNREVRMLPFHPDRLTLIDRELIGSRTRAIQKGLIDRSMEPFGVRLKQFWDIKQSEALLGPKFTKTLGHEPDGLIYQPSIDPYTPGVCKRVLKWKPHHMNSIDFRLAIQEERKLGMVPRKIGLLYVGGMEQSYGEIKLTKELRKLNNKIIECKYEEGAGWVLMRERTDKSFPNSYETARSVWESIRRPVTMEILLTMIKNEGYRSDSERMPPPNLQ
ncbi:mRNA-capping enzyme [Anopheles ziemanni]|uniref:mRNA-capping enzyme n=1 Tax=Anopheles coustani TaxID=139045 RepID=UPI0026594896|nr:mRNA-capping enzyme [Anopheles coustani]XP_058167075.1 mRNA-capping enzyme [Anopheles ziemanni]